MTEPHYSLDEIRLRLNDIDNELLTLFAERRKLSIEVAKNKVETSKPVRDAKREQQLLVKLINNGKKHELDAHYITQLFHTIIEDSVLLQQQYLQNLTNPQLSRKPIVRVAYLGAKGSYSNLASRRYFSKRNIELAEFGCENFKEVVKTVESGHAEYGVLPIENTSSGSINEVFDLLQHTSLYIVGEITQSIDHCILTTSDTSLENITTLYSHPQPLQQCSEFLSRLDGVELKSCVSTADAMVAVKELDSTNIGAIGNSSSGKLYGLQSIHGNIANQTENYTRFIVVARKPVEVSEQIPAKTTLIMSTTHDAGSLVESLLVLQKHNININKLESRPILGNPWEEMFYMDLMANIKSEEMSSVINELTVITKYLKVLGCYPIENVEPVTLKLS